MRAWEGKQDGSNVARAVQREESSYLSFYMEGFSAQSASRLFFFSFFFFPPSSFLLKKVINIQNIVAQINSYTPAASAPTKPMPVHVR